MATADELLVTLLVDLVERVPDQPKRVLFKGVSSLFQSFRERVSAKHPEWEVRITHEGTDIVSARNDPAIAVLVVFYRAEVQERESLNAFRLFSEDEIAKELVDRLATGLPLAGLSEVYDDDERDRLNSLLDLAYPSIEQLAEFLIAGKAQIGASLPLLNLFSDPGLRLDLPTRQWNARLRDNHEAAVLQWRDFVRKGLHTKAGRKTVGNERVQVLREAEIDPAVRRQVLAQITLDEARSVLYRPTRLVEQMMDANIPRDVAESLVQTVKSGQVGYAGELNLEPLLVGLPPLPEKARRDLESKAPVEESDEPEMEPESDLRRVGFCLEGLLRLARQEHPAFPLRLEIRRSDIDDDHVAMLEIREGRLYVSMDRESERFLSMSAGSGTSELQYEIRLTDDTSNVDKFYFSLGVMPGWLEDYAEYWPDDEYWDMATALDDAHADKWRALRRVTLELRNVVDPDWRQELPESAEHHEADREPNNPIYAIFDLLYFAHRDLFDRFLDCWLAVATLPWGDVKVSQKPLEWQGAMAGLLRLGTAQYTDSKTVLFPFYILRLAWYCEVFEQIESWLAHAAQTGQPLVFEPRILAEQLSPIDRPRALFVDGERWVEVSADTFFIVRFVPEDQHQRARAPLYRAGQKLTQFGRMWPFSLDRLHLAFQPGDASEDVYQLLIRESDAQPNTAYRVRALVETTGIITAFDRHLVSTSEDTIDLMSQEHHESMLPRVDYAKSRLDSGGREEELDGQATSTHITLVVDAFSEESFDFKRVVGRLDENPHWRTFRELAREGSPASRAELARVDISAPSYHTRTLREDLRDLRDLVYVPLSGSRPEYLRMLHDSLAAWQCQDEPEGVYYERVRWEKDLLERLHDRADWVLLFDRTLDKSLFETLTPAGVKLIDYHPHLRGGYKMSISSRRTEAVEWQLAQVLQQFFSNEELNVSPVAGEMLDTLSEFASGLLLKTLGGGSLAQELLGLYATYLSLIAEGEFVRGQDWLIPLDDYQSWFGRRTQRGRRADLLVLQNRIPGVLRLLAVESKWYKSDVSRGFVQNEFGEGGQMRVTVTSLRGLFDPYQDRLDKHYWRRTLASLLDTAPDSWDEFKDQSDADQWAWALEVDGIVYVHQYGEEDTQRLRARNEELLAVVAEHLSFPADEPVFCLGPDAYRLRLKARDEIVQLFSEANP